jgi:hydroxymethylglutaryl-CoA lyase
MAKDELVGNIATESMVAVLESKGELVGLDKSSLVHALKLADRVFSVH